MTNIDPAHGLSTLMNHVAIGRPRNARGPHLQTTTFRADVETARPSSAARKTASSTPVTITPTSAR
jgi:hypothetical protein